MSAPAPPPMLHYDICLKNGLIVHIVTSSRIRFENDLPKWMQVQEYHPNVKLYYWQTALREIWIKSSCIACVKFVEYIKPPLGKVRE